MAIQVGGWGPINTFAQSGRMDPALESALTKIALSADPMQVLAAQTEETRQQFSPAQRNEINAKFAPWLRSTAIELGADGPYFLKVQDRLVVVLNVMTDRGADLRAYDPNGKLLGTYGYACDDPFSGIC